MQPETVSDLRRRLQWFLLLRLGIATGLLAVTAFFYSRDATLIQSVQSVQAVQFLPVALALTYFVSLVSGLLLTRVQNLSVFSYVQVTFDTLFVTGIVLLTGGLPSPFPFLYHLIILNAAFLLFRRGAVVTATLAALSYGALSGLPLPFHEDFHADRLSIHLIVHFASFYAIALLGGYLTHKLLRTETLLAEREQDLGRIKSLYQGVIHNLESGIFVTDTDGVIGYANDPMGEIVNTAPQFLIGQRVEDVFPLLETSGLPTTPFEFSFLGQGEGSKERTVRLIKSPLLDTYGNRIGLLYSIQDVTSVKELERSLQETQEFERLGTKGADSSPTAPVGLVGLVGQSAPMQQFYQLVHKVAQSTITVLISGESGTGKEVVARAIHTLGPRTTQAFVPVNCGAIPDTLIESELFGSVKDAFTGAVRDRQGLFRQAHGGTLFLDEIGELPLCSQVKMLRVLQEREVTPVGGNHSIPVDVRILVATNKTLEEEVTAGRFREDLYYRLNVLSIPLPALRVRGGDLPLLMHHFLERSAIQNGKATLQVSPQAMRVLLDYGYPVNIRELENIIQHAVTMAEDSTIRLGDLPQHL